MLENHQPVRMLEGMQQSHRTSLNIRLKNKYTTTIPVVAGAGVWPVAGLAEFLPMVFSPQKQFIGGFKTNNTGKDISLDGLQHNSPLDLLAAQLERARTDIRRVSSPAIDPDRYRFNTSAYGTLNSLYRFRKDLQLRLNTGYMYDELNREGHSKTTYNLYEGAVIFSEENETRQRNRQFRAGAELSENSSRRFFNNELKISTDHKDGQGDLLTQNAHLDQKAKNRLRNFSNEFSYLAKVGTQLVQVSSAVPYKNNPQSLKILNSGYAFPFSENGKEVLQEVRDKKLHADLMLQAYRKIGGLNYTLKTRGELKHQQMDSRLSADSTGYYRNDLHWKESNLLIEPQIERNRDNLRLKINLPLAYRSFHIRDNLYGLNRKITRFPFEPSFSYDTIPGKTGNFMLTLAGVTVSG
ncbi:MAG: hypothetical protein LRY55_16005, partial [Leadbetterella sp.]|nr:hypothetical protein [Leadbetterella sp.]